jgi:DNA processing protein
VRILAIASIPNLTLEERLYLQSSSIKTSDLIKRCNKGEYEALLRWCDRKGNKWVSYGDKDYPLQLRSIEEAPFLLTYRGSLAMEGLGLSIVGHKRPSDGIILAASITASQCSVRGHTVVSGFEGGVPLFVHRAAHKSWALLSFGLEQVYLPRTARQIVERGGAVISEYHPEAPPSRGRFLHTSRLIGALSPVTLVYGAQWRTAAASTANYALDYGREVVVALQGQEEGATTALVEAGAPLVATLDEIMEVSGINYGRL